MEVRKFFSYLSQVITGKSWTKARFEARFGVIFEASISNALLSPKFLLSARSAWRASDPGHSIDENGSLPYKPRQLSAMARLEPGRLIGAGNGAFWAG